MKLVYCLQHQNNSLLVTFDISAVDYIVYFDSDFDVVNLFLNCFFKHVGSQVSDYCHICKT